MRIGSIYAGTKPVIAIYAGTKLIYARGRVSLYGLPTYVETDTEAVMRIAQALGLEVELYGSDLEFDANADMRATSSSAMLRMDDSEVDEIKMDAYADLYIKDTSPFVVVEDRTICIDPDMVSPGSVSMDSENNLETEIAVDAVASDSVAVECESISVVESNAEIVTPDANPVIFDSVIVENDVDAEATMSPSASIEGALSMVMDVVAVLTVAEVSRMECTTNHDTLVDAAADIFIKNTEWANPVLTDGRLYIPMSSSVTYANNRIRIE